MSEVRKNWPKFGLAVRNAESYTAVSTEEIPFENLRAKAKTMQQNKIEDIQKNLQSADKKTIVEGYIHSSIQRRPLNTLLILE